MQPYIARGGLIAATALVLSLGLNHGIPAQEASPAVEALTAKGAWSAAVIYRPDDVVTSRGSTWRAVRVNKNKVPGQTQPSTAAYWELLASGFNPTGAWVSTTKYQPNDLVTSAGSTWRAKRTNLNKAPVAGANWEQFAAVGTQGIQGIQGIQGPAGPNIGVPAGTLSAPGISFAGDFGTGIFSPTAGKIALAENGVAVLHFNSGNTGLGTGALGATSPGTGNTAVGKIALAQSGETGNNNTAVGEGALFSNQDGARNTGIGYNALFVNSSGGSNTAVGANALQSNAATGNVAVGDRALQTNSSGTSNTAVGTTALQGNTTTSRNTAVGFLALQGAGADDNTAVGSSALSSTTTGADNTAVGSSALISNIGGQDNTAVGVSALILNANGSRNIAIGSGAGSNPNASNDSIFIGNSGVVGDSATIKIGTKGTQSTTFIAGIRAATTGNNDSVPVLIDSAGQLGTINSSRRYKYDIETMADVSAMLGKLRPVSFRYKQAQNNGEHPLQYGLVAEEVAEVFPGLAVFKDGQPETVKYHLLPTFLLVGYQAQQKTIAAQAKEINAEAKEIAALKRRLAAIEARLGPPTKTAAR